MSKKIENKEGDRIHVLLLSENINKTKKNPNLNKQSIIRMKYMI